MCTFSTGVDLSTVLGIYDKYQYPQGKDGQSCVSSYTSSDVVNIPNNLMPSPYPQEGGKGLALFNRFLFVLTKQFRIIYYQSDCTGLQSGYLVYVDCQH